MLSFVLEPLNRWIRQLQHKTASALGVDENHRKDTVLAMNANNARRVPGYWIQLFLAMGIATLGLVLNSTAVVIGGMLVSPLMGPIIELGMGLAVGSSLLVLRAAMRSVLSVVLVVGSSALLALILPFHEVTSEIAARAAPTALDLLVAVFCALTAAYTTVRPGSDTTTAAAGTAIGIALVPPLCTVGFGLGVGLFNISSGAALLFIANLSAIVLFAVVTFLLLGFNQVSAEEVERDFILTDGRIIDWAGRANRRMSGFFGSRYGLATRVLIPGLLLASVFVPLRRALDEVKWEVQAREAVKRIVQSESPGAVQSLVTEERHHVTLQLRVATAGSGAELQQRIATRLEAATGVVPVVSVVEVADARAVTTLATSERRNQAALSANVPAQGTRQRVADALRLDWPTTAGTLVSWDFMISPADTTMLEVRHFGHALTAGERDSVIRAMAAHLAVPVILRDTPISTLPLAAVRRKEQAWLDSAVVLLTLLSHADSVVACLRGPGAAGGPLNARIDSTLNATDLARRGRVQRVPAPRWELQVEKSSCVRPVTTTNGKSR
jgi:uncharacterized hydrophobic protein (TIGR00271 family)